MKRLIVLCLVLIGTGAYFLSAKDVEQPIKNYPGKGTTTVAFGDSLIQGVGATEGNDLVALLEKNTGTAIVNRGVSGNTTRDGLARIDAVLEQDQPKLVIVLLGGNDVLRKIPKEETFKNLETIIQKIQASGSMVMLLGIQGGFFVDPYKEQFEQLSETYQTAYVESVLSGIIGKKELMFDSIHPNDAGYKIMADKVTPELAKLLK